MRHVTAAELPPRQLARLGRTSPALAAGCWPLAGPCVNDGADVGWAPTHDIVALDALRAAWERACDCSIPPTYTATAEARNVSATCWPRYPATR